MQKLSDLACYLRVHPTFASFTHPPGSKLHPPTPSPKTGEGEPFQSPTLREASYALWECSYGG